MADGGIQLPMYFSFRKSPVKMIEPPGGGIVAWRIDRQTGGWISANRFIDDILFDVGGEVFVRTRDEFVQEVERERARYLKGEGPIFALYETVRAIVEVQREEGRYPTDEEVALVRGIRRKTFRMFEEQLQRQGDPAADPSLAG